MAALLLALVIPAGRADSDGPAGPRAAIASLRGVALPAVIRALLAAGQYDLITYTLADLTDRVGLTLALASRTLGIVQVGGVGGRLLLGRRSDRPDRPTAVATAAGARALLFVALALVPHATALAARAGGMLLLGACAVG